MKTIMAIGGHVGDAELTAGAVLATHSVKGDRIVTVALTAGEKGNPKGISVEDYRKQKIEEANNFAKLLNGEAIVLDYKDAELEYSKEAVLKVAQVIRNYKPSIIMTHWKNSMHKDHALCHKIVLDAQLYACLDVEELIGDKHFAQVVFSENWEDSEGYVPYYYINVEEGYELYKKALKTSWFIMNSPSFKYYEYYTNLLKVRGIFARMNYAQTFTILEHQKVVKKEGF